MLVENFNVSRQCSESNIKTHNVVLLCTDDAHFGMSFAIGRIHVSKNGRHDDNVSATANNSQVQQCKSQTIERRV